MEGYCDKCGRPSLVDGYLKWCEACYRAWLARKMSDADARLRLPPIEG